MICVTCLLAARCPRVSPGRTAGRGSREVHLRPPWLWSQGVVTVTRMPHVPGLVKCPPTLGPEQTRLGGKRIGVPPCVEAPRAWEMPREPGPHWTVVLEEEQSCWALPAERTRGWVSGEAGEHGGREQWQRLRRALCQGWADALEGQPGLAQRRHWADTRFPCFSHSRTAPGPFSTPFPLRSGGVIFAFFMSIF